MGSYANEMHRADRLARERGKQLAKERNKSCHATGHAQTEAAMADVAAYEDWFVEYD